MVRVDGSIIGEICVRDILDLYERVVAVGWSAFSYYTLYCTNVHMPVYIGSSCHGRRAEFEVSCARLHGLESIEQRAEEAARLLESAPRDPAERLAVEDVLDVRVDRCLMYKAARDVPLVGERWEVFYPVQDREIWMRRDGGQYRLRVTSGSPAALRAMINALGSVPGCTLQLARCLLPK